MGDEIQFKAYEPRQGQLLPGFVGEALDPSDPVFFVEDVVEGLEPWAAVEVACGLQPGFMDPRFCARTLSPRLLSLSG